MQCLLRCRLALTSGRATSDTLLQPAGMGLSQSKRLNYQKTVQHAAEISSILCGGLSPVGGCNQGLGVGGNTHFGGTPVACAPTVIIFALSLAYLTLSGGQVCLFLWLFLIGYGAGFLAHCMLSGGQVCVFHWVFLIGCGAGCLVESKWFLEFWGSGTREALKWLPPLRDFLYHHSLLAVPEGGMQFAVSQSAFFWWCCLKATIKEPIRICQAWLGRAWSP
jgi:hypothetical protein